MTKSIRTRAAALAARTSDAYSADRYASWTAVAALLLRRGYSEEQAESIMRSKITRWAGDSSLSRRPTAADLGRYLDDSGDPVDLFEEEGIPTTRGLTLRLAGAACPPGIAAVMPGLALDAIRGDAPSASVLADALEGYGAAVAAGWWRAFAQSAA